MERNLRLYPAYQVARNAVFFLPVFFLYFSSVVSVEEVLLLEAIYYVGVVVFEVPSGYMSDRFGRRLTLLISGILWGGGGLLLGASHGFESFVVGQLCLAAGQAFNSGTDSSLLYDSLEELGRSREFRQREGNAHRAGLATAAVCAIVGGLVGGFSLRMTYLLFGVAALSGAACAFAMREPERPHRAESPLRQLVAVAYSFRNPSLRWIFAFAVGMDVLNHVPYEFYQPYLAFLFARPESEYSTTPAISGLLLGGAMAGGAWASGRAADLRARHGTALTLLGTTLMQVSVILAMGMFLNVLVALSFLLRSTPAAIFLPLGHAEVHARVHSGLRATWLSVQSLGGRLAFAGTLFLASKQLVDVEQFSPDRLFGVLRVYGAAGLVFLVVLALTVPRALKRSGSAP